MSVVQIVFKIIYIYIYIMLLIWW